MIGDPHGCLSEYDELRKQLAPRKDKDRVVILGDLVDRGPESAGVVRRVIENGDECLLGNHDEKHLRWRQEVRAWKARKGSPKSFPTTLTEKQIKDNLSIKPAEWDWIGRLPITIRLNETTVAVHAGMEPGRTLEEQLSEKMIRMRFVDRKGFWKDGVPYWAKPKKGYFWSEGWKGPDSIVYGHTSFDQPRVDIHKEDGKVRSWCVGIDTGCVYGNYLTALVLDSGKDPYFVPVKAKQVYYNRSEIVKKL